MRFKALITLTLTIISIDGKKSIAIEATTKFYKMLATHTHNPAVTLMTLNLLCSTDILFGFADLTPKNVNIAKAICTEAIVKTSAIQRCRFVGCFVRYICSVDFVKRTFFFGRKMEYVIRGACQVLSESDC